VRCTNPIAREVLISLAQGSLLRAFNVERDAKEHPKHSMERSVTRQRASGSASGRRATQGCKQLLLLQMRDCPRVRSQRVAAHAASLLGDEGGDRDLVSGRRDDALMGF
jgi:hypothetical protein